MKVQRWEMVAPGRPLELATRELEPLAPGEALVRVAGCGVCHTDLGFLYDGVKTRHALPLALGHEVAGVVEDAGSEGRSLLGAEVVVPAVIPCGRCDLCLRGRGSICARQVFPGNDVHGGFASHLVVPARGLVRVPRSADALPRPELAELAVVADAVTTPFQAVRRSGLGAGDVAIFVGAGGVGAFGVQIAAALGAFVVAIDVDRDRLSLAASLGAGATFDASVGEPRAMRRSILEQARERGLPAACWKVFETSGTRAGQETAFRLLVPGAYLSVVGYTRDDACVPLSHLMAFDATAEGNWGCLPELYPEALRLVLEGRVRIPPLVERHPLSQVNEVLRALHAREIKRRPVLVPDFA